MSEPQITGFDWAFWFLWIMATTLGWILGRFLLPNLATVIIGVTLGVMQWLVIRERIPKAWRWIVVTIIGWIFGSLLIQYLVTDGGEFLAGTILGCTVGIAQWIILRKELQWTGWWIVINIVAWTTGMALLPGIFSTGAMIGAITGIALGLLLQFPKPKNLTAER